MKAAAAAEVVFTLTGPRGRTAPGRRRFLPRAPFGGKHRERDREGAAPGGPERAAAAPGDERRRIAQDLRRRSPPRGAGPRRAVRFPGRAEAARRRLQPSARRGHVACPATR